jgi:hypothetical protein
MSYFSPEALEKFQAMCAEGMDFSEGNTYDFAKCVMPDGEVYGVEPGESCKQGKPIADGKKPEKKKEDGGAQMAKLKRAFIKKTGREMNKQELAKAQKLIGIPIPYGSSAEKELQKMVPKGEKVGAKTA